MKHKKVKMLLRTVGLFMSVAILSGTGITPVRAVENGKTANESIGAYIKQHVGNSEVKEKGIAVEEGNKALTVSDSDTPTGGSQIFYVDANNGDDSNDGKTKEKAWKSIGKINSHTFQPGDQILFKDVYGKGRHSTL